MSDSLNQVETITDAKELEKDLLPSLNKKSLKNNIWIIFLVTVCAIATFAYIRQIKYGLSVTAMGDMTSWGIYISNFVFFVAISLVGSLISSILKLSKAHWATPLTRISEIIAVASIMMAAMIIVIDMGRPDRFFYVITHGRIQSPIIWDVIVIATYFAISVWLLYIPLIPCIALCRDRLTNIPKWQKWLYRFLAINWQGTPRQYRIIKRLIRMLIVMIIPVAFSIHTVTSWLFATTWRPGWDSTNFGPYFVSGAFMAGAAVVIVFMYAFRKSHNLYKYITESHFDNMGKLLVLLSLVYLYFNINEYMGPAYKMTGVEGEHVIELFSGKYAPMYWLVQIFGMLLPIVLLLFSWARKPLPLLIISATVLIGAWLKRFLIVIPSLSHPYLPYQNISGTYTYYIPTWEEWAITMGSFTLALLIITFFGRLFPLIPIWEIAEEKGIDKELFNKKIENNE